MPGDWDDCDSWASADRWRGSAGSSGSAVVGVRPRAAAEDAFVCVLGIDPWRDAQAAQQRARADLCGKAVCDLRGQTVAAQECSHVLDQLAWVLELRAPGRDSNLRSRLRRALDHLALTSRYALPRVPPGHVLGTAWQSGSACSLRVSG
jgi:hypothetical protein